MKNHNNYPDEVVNFCIKMANALWDNRENEEIPSIELLAQAVYDVVSTKIFDQFLIDGNTDKLIYDTDEDGMEMISLIFGQIDLLELAEKGIIISHDNGESFELSEAGKKLGDKLYGKNKTN